MTCVPRNTVQLLQCTSICYGRRGEVKKTGMHRYHPPPRIHECFPIFPCKDMWYFSQPHSERNNNNYFFTVLCVFFGFLPSPKPGSFWWLWYHFFTICRGIYWAEECLFYFGPFDKVKKKKIKHTCKKIKRRKKCHDVGGRTSDLRFTGDRMKPELLGKLPYIWRQTGRCLWPRARFKTHKQYMFSYYSGVIVVLRAYVVPIRPKAVRRATCLVYGDAYD